MDTPDIGVMLQRLTSLEHEGRRLRASLRRLWCLIACSCVVLVLTGAAVLQATKFDKAVEVFDANTVLRAILFADDGNNRSGLEIRDKQGRVRLRIESTQNEDAVLVFRDLQGKTRVRLGVDQQGRAFVACMDQNGGGVQQLSVNP